MGDRRQPAIHIEESVAARDGRRAQKKTFRNVGTGPPFGRKPDPKWGTPFWERGEGFRGPEIHEKLQNSLYAKLPVYVSSLES